MVNASMFTTIPALLSFPAGSRPGSSHFASMFFVQLAYADFLAVFVAKFLAMISNNNTTVNCV